MSLTLAAIQCAVPEGVLPDAQAVRVMSLIDQAADQGATLIVLPELITAHYFPQYQATPENLQRAHALAQTLPAANPNDFTALLHQQAQRRHIRIIASVYERTPEDAYYNTLVLITPDSQVAATYRKVHIPDDPKFYERPYFALGKGHTTWPTPDITLGPMVCYDQWYPEAARIATLAGAQALIYPTAIGWDTNESSKEQHRQREAWITIQRSHAIANMVFVVACNRVGTEDGLTFWGSSFIAAPGGEILAAADEQREQIIIAEIDQTRIEQVRAIWPLLSDRRPGVYQTLSCPMPPDR